MKLLLKLGKGIVNNATIMSWSAYFVQFGSGLIVLPLILLKYNETDQAFWFLVGTIRGFAMLAETGFGFIIIRAVSYFYSGLKKLPKNLEEYNQTDTGDDNSPNYHGLSELLSTIKVIYIFLALVVLILVGTLGILTVKNLFTMAGNPDHLWWSYFFVALSTIVYIQTIQWQNFMGGLNYVALSYRFGTIMGIIRIIVFSIMLVSNLGVEYLSFYILIDSIFAYIYYRWFVNNWFSKNYSRAKGLKFNKEIFSSLWPITWRTGITQWGEYFLNNGVSILAAQIKNVPLMASFLFTLRVFMMVRRTSEAPFYTHIPIVYRLMAVKDFKQLKQKASVYIFFSINLQIITLLILGIWGNQILYLVGINTTFVPANMFLLLSLTLLILTHAGFHANIYVSTNHIPYMIPMIISGGVLLGVGYLLLDTYGLMGIITLQLFIWLLFLGWYQVYISLKLLKWNFFVYLKDVLRYSSNFILSKAKLLKNHS